MTEEQWSTSSNPDGMLTFLGRTGRFSRRKARLFAVACCQRIWSLLGNDASREAVEAAELYADGRITAEELDQRREAAAGRPEGGTLPNGTCSPVLAAMWTCQRVEALNSSHERWVQLQ